MQLIIEITALKKEVRVAGGGAAREGYGDWDVWGRHGLECSCASKNDIYKNINCNRTRFFNCFHHSHLKVSIVAVSVLPLDTIRRKPCLASNKSEKHGDTECNVAAGCVFHLSQACRRSKLEILQDQLSAIVKRSFGLKPW